MATFVPHSGPAGISKPDTARSATSPAVSSNKTVTSRKVSAYEPGEQPSKASSVIPVLVAFGALFVLTFGAAYYGRDLITVVSKLLGT